MRLPSPAGLTNRLASARGAGTRVTRSVWLLAPGAAAVAAAVVFVLLLVPLALSWMTAPETEVSWRGSARLAGLGWLVAHDASLRIEDVTYTLMPWGLVLIPVVVLIATTRWLGRAARIVELRRALIAVLLITTAYAVIAGVLAHVVSTAEVAVSVMTAALSAAVIAALATVWGLAPTGCWTAILAQLPAPLRVIVRAGLLGFFVLLGFGAILTAAAAVTGFDQVLALAVGLDAGPAGGLVLFIVQLAYIPVLIVWALSYLAGAGVNLGADTLLSPFVNGTAPTQLPSAPILALLPENAGGLAWALPILVVLAGTFIGILVGRRAAEENWMMRIVIVVAATSLSALMVLAITSISTGSWGVANLAQIGPDPGLTAMITWLLLTMGAVPVSLVVVARRSRHLAVLRTPVNAGSASASEAARAESREGSTARTPETHDELV